MSNVVRLATSRPQPSQGVRGPAYPRQTHAEMIEAEVNALYEISSEFYNASQDERKLIAVLARAEPLLGTYPGELKSEIKKALAPATVDEIRKHIVLLLDSNPRAQRLTESFGDLVESDVGSLEPSKGAIEAACRYLRTTPRPEFKPVPDIPEIVEAVKSKQRRLEMAESVIDGMPAKIEEARKQLAEWGRINARRRELAKSDIRSILTDRFDSFPETRLRQFNAVLVDEVKAELQAEAEQNASAAPNPTETPPPGDALSETLKYF